MWTLCGDPSPHPHEAAPLPLPVPFPFNHLVPEQPPPAINNGPTPYKLQYIHQHLRRHFNALEDRREANKLSPTRRERREKVSRAKPSNFAAKTNIQVRGEKTSILLVFGALSG
eukprot:TRINITY_DN12423_c0_g1_i2.p1 TRINITY_DN12423_c0_g1~~TRINITY_DN12423_c0_g1_i2.p1  ORF type:complete len:114 (+),score=15.45 TRINITY_DN12423_c0_g1_i2:222-563(+)